MRGLAYPTAPGRPPAPTVVGAALVQQGGRPGGVDMWGTSEAAARRLLVEARRRGSMATGPAATSSLVEGGLAPSARQAIGRRAGQMGIYAPWARRSADHGGTKVMIQDSSRERMQAGTWGRKEGSVWVAGAVLRDSTQRGSAGAQRGRSRRSGRRGKTYRGSCAPRPAGASCHDRRS